MPEFLAYRHPRFRTPSHAVLISWILISGLCYFDFMDNLAINNFFSCGSCILEIAAFLKLRYSKPDLPRPFRAPLSGCWTVLLAVPPLLLGCVVLFSSCTQSWSSLIMNGAAVIVGLLLYASMKQCGKMKYRYDPRRRRLLSESESEEDTLASP